MSVAACLLGSDPLAMPAAMTAASMPTDAADLTASNMWSLRRATKEALMVPLAMMLLPRMMHGKGRCVAAGIHWHAVGIGRVTVSRIAIRRAVIGPKASA